MKVYVGEINEYGVSGVRMASLELRDRANPPFVLSANSLPEGVKAGDVLEMLFLADPEAVPNLLAACEGALVAIEDPRHSRGGPFCERAAAQLRAALKELSK